MAYNNKGIWPTEINDKWRNFFCVVFDPWVLVWSFAIGYFIYLAARQTNPIIFQVWILIITISSAILGIIISRIWYSITEESVIITRGKTSVRGLKLLLGNIHSLEKRTRVYLQRHKSDELDKEVIKTYLEEIIGKCISMEEETISSIENWTDIIKEADITSQIGTITSLQSQVEEYSNTLNSLREEAKEAEGKSQEEVRRLHEEIKKKEELVSKMRTDLAYNSAKYPYIAPRSSGEPVSFLGQENLKNIVFKPGEVKFNNSFSISKPSMRDDESNK